MITISCIITYCNWVCWE